MHGLVSVRCRTRRVRVSGGVPGVIIEDCFVVDAVPKLVRPEGLLAEIVSSGRFPRTLHVAGFHEERRAVGNRDRVAHCFPRRQCMATDLVRVVLGCHAFSRELRAMVHGNGAGAAVRLEHVTWTSHYN